MSQEVGKCSSRGPQQALFWIVGDVDSLNLGNTLRFVECRHPPAPVTNRALLKTRPYRVYTPPNRHSTLRVKATLKSVQDDLTSGGDDEGDTLENVLGEDSTFPFTFDGSTIIVRIRGLRRVPTTTSATSTRSRVT
jgi:hypothetical protein